MIFFGKTGYISCLYDTASQQNRKSPTDKTKTGIMCCLETYFFSLLQTARLVFVLKKTVRSSCLFCHVCGEDIAIVGRLKRDNVWRQRVKNSTMQ